MMETYTHSESVLYAKDGFEIIKHLVLRKESIDRNSNCTLCDGYRYLYEISFNNYCSFRIAELNIKSPSKTLSACPVCNRRT